MSLEAETELLKHVPSTSEPAASASLVRAGLPRWFEAVSASAALIVASPLLIGIAILVKATSPGPALFRQTRIGRGGKPFELLKFRSMRTLASANVVGAPPTETPYNDQQDAQVTASGDPRVTGLGRILRAAKLDELPELINVVRGEMSFVGPRPEVPAFVDQGNPLWRQVLRVRPGLTDRATLMLRNEEQVIRLGAKRTGLPVEAFYRRHLLPFKLAKSIEAQEQRSIASDLCTLLVTAWALLGRRGGAARSMELVDDILGPSDER